MRATLLVLLLLGTPAAAGPFVYAGGQVDSAPAAGGVVGGGVLGPVSVIGEAGLFPSLRYAFLVASADLGRGFAVGGGGQYLWLPDGDYGGGQVDLSWHCAPVTLVLRQEFPSPLTAIRFILAHDLGPRWFVRTHIDARFSPVSVGASFAGALGARL